MGGIGSGRHGGRPTVEGAWRLDIDDLLRWGAIRTGGRAAGGLRFTSSGNQVEAKFESVAECPDGDCWLRLRYRIADYWTGQVLEIDDKIYLAASRPPFGGLRWWFVCPHENERVRKLYLPLSCTRFRSRRAYRLAYAC
jgi:hypothetical protein